MLDLWHKREIQITISNSYFYLLIDSFQNHFGSRCLEYKQTVQFSQKSDHNCRPNVGKKEKANALINTYRWTTETVP